LEKDVNLPNLERRKTGVEVEPEIACQWKIDLLHLFDPNL